MPYGRGRNRRPKCPKGRQMRIHPWLCPRGPRGDQVGVGRRCSHMRPSARSHRLPYYVSDTALDEEQGQTDFRICLVKFAGSSSSRYNKRRVSSSCIWRKLETDTLDPTWRWMALRIALNRGEYGTLPSILSQPALGPVSSSHLRSGRELQGGKVHVRPGGVSQRAFVEEFEGEMHVIHDDNVLAAYRQRAYGACRCECMSFNQGYRSSYRKGLCA